MRANQKLLSPEVISYVRRLIDILTFRVAKFPDFGQERLCLGKFVVCLFCCGFSGTFCQLELGNFWIVNRKNIVT